MRSPLFIFLMLAVTLATAQTGTQSKALNAYVDYANQSANEVSSVVKSIILYYPTLRQKSSWMLPRYVCPVQLDDYYYNNAVKEGKSLNAAIATGVNARLNDLRQSSQNIDAKCKALDTYHKLEDYKQDNYARAETLVNEIHLAVEDYRKKQEAFETELLAASRKLGNSTTGAYAQADQLLRKVVQREHDFLDSWNYNLNAKTPTGWDVERLKSSIEESAKQLDVLKQMKPALKYPASAAWSSIAESCYSILEGKRRGLDGYNFEARKSDEHANAVYLDLINYFNGTLISNQNMFVQYADADGYHGLKAIKYVPAFDIKSQAKTAEVMVTPFKDIAHAPLSPPSQKTAIGKAQFESLTNYVTLMNEMWRQIRLMRMSLVSFNSSAAYYKGLASYEGRGGISFDYSRFQLPQSQYQLTINGAKNLPPALAKPLNEQASVLFAILKEMDDLAAVLTSETVERLYEKDHLKHIYEILEREKLLMETWDDRKEQHYTDVRAVYESYPQAQPGNNWFISGKALRTLTDHDHDALFQAKAHYKTGSPASVETSKIDDALRDVIAKEYDNMKGIAKIGRNNGNCPYTPYEDLPLSSKSMSEELKRLKPVGGTNTEHPYYRIVYHYNDVVDDYNKFCELSQQVMLLQTVKQPELYDVQYPNPAQPKQPDKVSAAANTPAPTIKEEVPVDPGQTSRRARQERRREPEPQPIPATPPITKTTNSVQHDTVYIERRDTVYVAEPGENLRSMEGYATNNLILLLDVSGSMNAPEKLPLLKASVVNLLSMMRQEDRVTIISFSDKPKAMLTAASFKDETKIKKAINDLKSSGRTDGNAGLKLAYKTADDNYIRGGNNRIILATDGEFALSDETRQLIQKFSTEDIFLSIFNFGKGMGASKTLQGVASMGKGNYQYISPQNVDVQLIREVKAKKKR